MDGPCVTAVATLVVGVVVWVAGSAVDGLCVFVVVVVGGGVVKVVEGEVNFFCVVVNKIAFAGVVGF